MPQDDVRPCPHCGGTGEVRGDKATEDQAIMDAINAGGDHSPKRGETLADKIERARAITMTPAMQEEQRQSWARGEMGMLNTERRTTTVYPGDFCIYDHLRDGWEFCSKHSTIEEARTEAKRLREKVFSINPVIFDSDGERVPNTTGCGICNDPNCDNPSGKH